MQKSDLIKIEVQTNYKGQHRDGLGDIQHFFSYTITINNSGAQPAKLINRHWIITDGNNYVEEVRGKGVVGEQPYLNPGEYFQYTSSAVLKTPVGTMEGEYEMEYDSGERFFAPIPVFSLVVQDKLH